VSEGYLTSSRVTIVLHHGDDDDNFVVEMFWFMLGCYAKEITFIKMEGLFPFGSSFYEYDVI
jgi:hypothetical protein